MQFLIEVNIERVSGAFVSGDEIAEELESQLGELDVSCIGDHDSEYEITDTSVEFVRAPRRKKSKRVEGPIPDNQLMPAPRPAPETTAQDAATDAAAAIDDVRLCVAPMCFRDAEFDNTWCSDHVPVKADQP